MDGGNDLMYFPPAIAKSEGVGNAGMHTKGILRTVYIMCIVYVCWVYACFLCCWVAVTSLLELWYG